MHTYSLLELNTYIKQVVALNFEDPVWITCEISQIRTSRGQVYMELIQQNEEQTDIVATSGATIWYKNHLFIKKKLGDLYDAILQDGTQVSLKIQVAFHERYGLKLNVVDIDPTYTIGQLEMQRQQIVERLKTEGILYDNAAVDLPIVFRRVAVISSEQAAGYKDFMHQLHDNSYGYAFDTTLYHVAVQGVKVEAEVVQTLMQIKAAAEDYDCVVIIRGGGSRLDLAGFDNYNIGYHIATCPIPVFTGIGHEIDNTVADIVAHTSVKTPTAAADFLVEFNLHFESAIIDLAQRIQQGARVEVQQHAAQLDSLSSRLSLMARHLINQRDRDLESFDNTIEVAARHLITTRRQDIDHLEQLVNIMDPKEVLKRGYAILTKAGRVAKSIKDVNKGDQVEIQVYDGSIDASVN
jgi:exodeoxyribonuclease VII large subunit